MLLTGQVVMCVGIALAWSELPLALHERHGLARRTHERAADKEVRFLYREREPCLPVWHERRLRFVRWGSRRGQSRRLPATGWTWQATVEAGGWAQCGAEPVEFPATMGLERGIWFPWLDSVSIRSIDDRWNWADGAVGCQDCLVSIK